MSAPAVKPALPSAGAQAPKVGSGAPSAAPNNPSPPVAVAGGPKVLPTTGSPNRPLAPPNANHTTMGALPLSLVQEHKGGGGLNQQPQPINRTPEKPKENPVTGSMGIKPTSNGVEGSPNRPTATSQPTLENKKPDEGAVATAVMNHSAEIAATPPQPQPTPHNPPMGGIQTSPAKPQPTSVTSGTSNHSAVHNKPEGSTVEAKPPTSAAAAQPTEPPSLPTLSSSVPAPQIAASTPQTQQPQAPILTQAPAPQSTVPQSQPTPPPQPPSQPTQQSQQLQKPAVQQPPQPQQPPPQVQQQPPPQPQQPKPTPAPPPQQTSPPQPPAPPQVAAPSPPQAQPAPAPQPQQVPPAAPPVQPQAVTPPTQETPAKPVEPTKTRVDAPKPEFKVATPPRNSKRKREVKPPAETPTTGAKTPASSEQDDGKPKRVRTQTQPYQSPLPELPYIAKLKTLMKSPDDKLIVFYKNEFLAVRNAEGSFYICQAMQNIYKSSPRIRIRWLSQEKKDNKPTDVYIPDFYDATDFDCILTNLELKRLDKNKYQLPEEERERTQSILKRALDVEKGVSEKPPVTEEHPDGLDLSLFRDESQLKKRKSLKRSTPRKKGKENTSGTEDGLEETGDEESEEEVKKKKPKQIKKVEKPKEKTKTKEKPVEKKAERVSERGRDRSLAAKRRSEPTATPAKNTAAKQTVAKQAVTKTAEKKTKVVAKTPKKPEPVVETSIPTRSTKTRSVKVTSQPKSSPVTRTKERERRGAVPVKGKKKPGKKA